MIISSGQRVYGVYGGRKMETLIFKDPDHPEYEIWVQLIPGSPNIEIQIQCQPASSASPVVQQS
jgi:hypothetical protein